MNGHIQRSSDLAIRLGNSEIIVSGNYHSVSIRLDNYSNLPYEKLLMEIVLRFFFSIRNIFTVQLVLRERAASCSFND